MHRWFPLLLIIPLIAVAAPVPKETEAQRLKRLFGEVVDAKKGHDFTLDGDKLVVKMGANASKGFGSELIPTRVEREVKGDFEARVVVDLTPPKGRFDDAGANPNVIAGFSLWAKDGRSMVRGVYYGSFGGNNNADGWSSGFFMLQTPTNANKRTVSFGQRREFVRFDKYHILIRREGDKLKYGESVDGKEWQIGAGGPCDLPDTVSVGVIALNTTTAACEAAFSNFTVTPLKPAK